MQRKMKSKISLVLLVSTLSSCASAPPEGAPISSMCKLDFEEKKCWVSRTKNIFRTFTDMNDCHFGGECWFAIESADLKRIEEALNK